MNDELRPIGARALKSAGDTLRPYLSDAKVLDLYAGQGRFGIVALEEEAAHVSFVESHRATVGELRKALARYGERAKIFPQDVFSFLSSTTDSFDLIFADPPFPDWTGDFQARLFGAASQRLQAEGIFLVKHPSRVVLSECSERFKPWKSAVFGESTLAYFRYASDHHQE